MKLVLVRHAKDPDTWNNSHRALSIGGYLCAALLGAVIRFGRYTRPTRHLPVIASDMARAESTARIMFGTQLLATNASLREAADADLPPRLRGPDWIGSGERWCDVVERVGNELMDSIAADDDVIWVTHSGVMDAVKEVLFDTSNLAEFDPGYLWMLVLDINPDPGDSFASTQTIISYFGPALYGLRYFSDQ